MVSDGTLELIRGTVRRNNFGFSLRDGKPYDVINRNDVILRGLYKISRELK